MASSTPDVEALLRQMSSLGISSQRLQAASQNPLMLQELLTELESKSPEALAKNQVDRLAAKQTEDIEEEMRRIQATMTKEKELGPAPPQTLPRDLFIQVMIDSRKRFAKKIRRLKEGSECELRKAFVGTEKYFSETPLCHLNRIALRDMLVRKVHKGNYLLCRVLVLPTRLVAVEVGIEDPEGGVRLLALYNIPSMMTASLEEMDFIFPVGTILAIREPYLKTSLQTGSSFLRVDSPSDIVFVDPGARIMENVTWTSGRRVPGMSRFPSTVSEWKEVGNKQFKDSHWLAAAIAYTKGLTMEPGAVVVRANRAAAYLKLQYYSAALSDAEEVLESFDTPDHVRRKALFRAGQAQYGRGKFETAIVHFEASRKHSSNDSDADAWIRRATTRLSEEKFGRYDWLRLFLDSNSAASASDVADHVGPIEVVSLPSRGGGRGVMAARDIRVGELLVVAKPFAAVFPEELSNSDTIMAVNLITKKLDLTCQCIALSRTVDKIHGNPELHDLVYHLCPRPPYSPPPPSYPPPTPSSLSIQHPLNCAVDINIALLENICSNNMFMPQPLHYAEFKRPKFDEDKSMDSPVALYLLPSLFNHACAENASRVFFREVMVIRAKININKGEEIVLSYHPGTTAFTRQKRLDSYHFTCTCTLCEEDRADGEQACQRRDELVDSIMNRGLSLTEAPHLAVTTLKRLIKQVSDTYSAGRSSVRPATAGVQHRLSHELQVRAANNPHLYHQAIAEEMKALEAAGVYVTDKSTEGPVGQPQTHLPITPDRGPVGTSDETCVLQMLMIVASFLSLCDFLRAERWLRAAWWLEDITVGGGRALFEERYKKILNTTGIIMWSDTIRA